MKLAPKRESLASETVIGWKIASETRSYRVGKIMAYTIIPASTDSTYTAVMDSIRKRLSPFALAPITAEQLPNAFIDDDIYIYAAEMRVIADKETTVVAAAALDRASTEYRELLILTETRIAIELISQVPQQLSAAVLQQRADYAEIDWETRVEILEGAYTTTLDPTATGAGGVDSGSLVTKARISNSRIY